jgi:hypothetical protein
VYLVSKSRIGLNDHSLHKTFTEVVSKCTWYMSKENSQAARNATSLKTFPAQTSKTAAMARATSRFAFLANEHNLPVPDFPVKFIQNHRPPLTSPSLFFKGELRGIPSHGQTSIGGKMVQIFRRLAGSICPVDALPTGQIPVFLCVLCASEVNMSLVAALPLVMNGYSLDKTPSQVHPGTVENPCRL